MLFRSVCEGRLLRRKIGPFGGVDGLVPATIDAFGVGDSVGGTVGDAVGRRVGIQVGRRVRVQVGRRVGVQVGRPVGIRVGRRVGIRVGPGIREVVGEVVGRVKRVGRSVGVLVVAVRLRLAGVCVVVAIGRREPRRGRVGEIGRASCRERVSSPV